MRSLCPVPKVFPLTVAALCALAFGVSRAALTVAASRYIQVLPAQACWQPVPGGYRPRVTVSVTPTEKLEALVVGGQFLHAGQSGQPVVTYQEDAEANIHYRSVILGRTVLARRPSATEGAAVTLSARILPYAARNTTQIGSVHAVTLATFKLSAVCKS
ncbi:hypothetical protein [Deinococcus sp. UYEF24]